MKISDVKLLVKINATVDELREGIEALMAERDDLIAERDQVLASFAAYRHNSLAERDALIVDRDAWKARCLGHTPVAKEER